MQLYTYGYKITCALHALSCFVCPVTYRSGPTWFETWRTGQILDFRVWFPAEAAVVGDVDAETLYKMGRRDIALHDDSTQLDQRVID